MKKYYYEELIQTYKKQLEIYLNSLKGNNLLPDSDIYNLISREYAVIISDISNDFPEIKLSDLQPITNTFQDVQNDYCQYIKELAGSNF
ncbi:hypothetical protein [Oceanobacillus timonensis]|uniref:hypothetical protein n=1 Tax=Oceanobacillus timonensis TaxID=1926285 RepID=UPI0009BC2A8A|nr:hypothetical protein [Oceanobacillus timonensis]